MRVFGSSTCQTIRQVKFIVIEIHPHQSVTKAELISKIQSCGFERVADSIPGNEDVHLFRNTAI